MTSVQRKFAAGAVSLFIIPFAHYIGQTTKLTPDACAEPIYEFTKSIAPTASATPPKVRTTGYDGDIPPARIKEAEKIVSKESQRQGITIEKLQILKKIGDDGKPSFQVLGKVTASTVS